MCVATETSASIAPTTAIATPTAESLQMMLLRKKEKKF
jgi:hypothetical protein